MITNLSNWLLLRLGYITIYSIDLDRNICMIKKENNQENIIENSTSYNN